MHEFGFVSIVCLLQAKYSWKYMWCIIGCELADRYGKISRLYKKLMFCNWQTFEYESTSVDKGLT